MPAGFWRSQLVSVLYQAFKFVDNMLRLIVKLIAISRAVSLSPFLTHIHTLCRLSCLLQLNKSIDWFLRCVRLRWRCREFQPQWFLCCEQNGHFSGFPASYIEAENDGYAIDLIKL